MAELPDNAVGYKGTRGLAAKVTPPGGTLVEGWLVEAKGWSPAWWHFLIAIIHLRPDEVCGPPSKRFPQATHELTVNALDPEKNPVPTDSKTWCMLQPGNVCWQFTCPDDITAARACRQLAREAADGNLCLETQGITGAHDHWAMRLKAMLPTDARIE